MSRAGVAGLSIVWALVGSAVVAFCIGANLPRDQVSGFRFLPGATTAACFAGLAGYCVAPRLVRGDRRTPKLIGCAIYVSALPIGIASEIGYEHFFGRARLGLPDFVLALVVGISFACMVGAAWGHTAGPYRPAR